MRGVVKSEGSLLKDGKREDKGKRGEWGIWKGWTVNNGERDKGEIKKGE